MMSSVEWTPTIQYYISSQEKRIYIAFNYPPKETGLHEFKVRLVELHKDGYDFRLARDVSISKVYIVPF